MTLGHHLYNQLTDTWVKQASKSQPFINVVAILSPTDYATLGSSTSLSPRSWLTLVAKVALLGSMQLIILASQLRVSFLLPSRLHAASNVGINILSATILRFSGHSPSGQLLEKRQLTYVTDCSSKVFLGREACSEFGMIPHHFPTISEVMLLNNATSAAAYIQQPNATSSLSTPPLIDTGLTAQCSCPKCQLPPPKPDTIPFPPTEENREKLQAWLIGYYCSSTFNMCKQQPLPVMEGPPM